MDTMLILQSYERLLRGKRERQRSKLSGDPEIVQNIRTTFKREREGGREGRKEGRREGGRERKGERERGREREGRRGREREREREEKGRDEEIGGGRRRGGWGLETQNQWLKYRILV